MSPTMNSSSIFLVSAGLSLLSRSFGAAVERGFGVSGHDGAVPGSVSR
jgi:hypothetical protein